jgi:arylsulfatase A-like enzyme
LLAALRANGLEENTLILHTADHGEGMAAHQWVVKLMCWENIIGVPLTLSWPGHISSGQQRRQLVSGMDVLPTLCDYAGIPVPNGVTGQSLRTSVEANGDGRDFVVVQLHPDTEDPTFAERIVISRRYKYVVFSEGRRRELLFDLETDPGETVDLSSRSGSLEVLDLHRQYLQQWVTQTNDSFAPIN